MIYKNVKCYYRNGMPVWCGNWPQDLPIPNDAVETTCDAIVGPDGRLYHCAYYADFRRSGYPPLGDQIDALYKTLSYLASNGIDIGPDGKKWIEEIQAVKEAYPKLSQT